MGVNLRIPMHNWLFKRFSQHLINKWHWVKSTITFQHSIPITKRIIGAGRSASLSLSFAAFFSFRFRTPFDIIWVWIDILFVWHEKIMNRVKEVFGVSIKVVRRNWWIMPIVIANNVINIPRRIRRRMKIIRSNLTKFIRQQEPIPLIPENFS